uniref:Uncharacterized protein n=1 Tax=Anguilla anguilla TaxID=7936 RepID=A0A0E9SHU7_ANGAN
MRLIRNFITFGRQRQALL